MVARHFLRPYPASWASLDSHQLPNTTHADCPRTHRDIFSRIIGVFLLKTTLLFQAVVETAQLTTLVFLLPLLTYYSSTTSTGSGELSRIFCCTDLGCNQPVLTQTQHLPGFSHSWSRSKAVNPSQGERLLELWITYQAHGDDGLSLWSASGVKTQPVSPPP